MAKNNWCGCCKRCIPSCHTTATWLFACQIVRVAFRLCAPESSCASRRTSGCLCLRTRLAIHWLVGCGHCRWLVGCGHCRTVFILFPFSVGHRPADMCFHVASLDAPAPPKPEGRKLSTIAPSTHGRLTDAQIACHLIDRHDVGKGVNIIHNSYSLNSIVSIIHNANKPERNSAAQSTSVHSMNDHARQFSPLVISLAPAVKIRAVVTRHTFHSINFLKMCNELLFHSA